MIGTLRNDGHVCLAHYLLDRCKAILCVCQNARACCVDVLSENFYVSFLSSTVCLYFFAYIGCALMGKMSVICKML